MRLLFSLFLSLCLPLGTQAQTLSPDARSAALAGIGLLLDDDGAGGQSPANVPPLSKPVFSLQSAFKYGLKDLKNFGLGFRMPAGQQGSLGIALGYGGFEGQYNHKISASYGRKLGLDTEMGIELGYLWQRSPDFGWQARPLMALAAQYRLHPQWRFGAWLQQPFQLLTPQSSADFVWQMAVSYQIQSQFITLFALEKRSLDPLSPKLGIEYRHNHLQLRLGLSLPYWQFSAGFGWRTEAGYSLDLSVAQHGILGTTPTLSIKRHLQKLKKSCNFAPETPKPRAEAFLQR